MQSVPSGPSGTSGTSGTTTPPKAGSSSFSLFPLSKRTSNDALSAGGESLYQLRPSQTKVARDAISAVQGGKCFICQESFSISVRACLDHQHKRRRSDPNGPDGAGCVRGVLCSACNVLEGKIWNVSYRHKRSKKQIPALLRQLACYYEAGWYPCIHPSEKPTAPKVSKRQYNRLQKALEQSRPNAKMPPFPRTKNKKITKGLEKLFAEFGIDPYDCTRNQYSS